MILVISGSRYTRDKNDKDIEFRLSDEQLSIMFDTLVSSNRITKLIHGGAVGFDQCVHDYFYRRFPSIEIEIMKPNYIKGDSLEIKHKNKYAPIKRNQEMVYKADILVACKSHNKSNGTQSAIEFAKVKGIPFIEYLNSEKISTEEI